jgi:hypothetical protein
MVERPNNPVEKAREFRRRLFIPAKRTGRGSLHALFNWTWRGDVPPVACDRYDALVTCMPDEKIIGKPYAGNPHVRFERGPQVVGSVQMNTNTIT